MNVKRLLSPALPLLSVCLVTALAAAPTRADVLVQTATLGPTGQPDGIGLADFQYWGVRFQTTQDYTLTNVQIHASTISGGNGLLFAAIVPLTDLSDLPDAGDPAIIADDNPIEFQTFTAPVDNSALITIPFSESLPAGFFAVVFGSGEFGATGSGRVALNNPQIGTPSYIIKSLGFFLNPNVGLETYLAVNGTTVAAAAAPEPGTLALLGVGLGMVGLVARRRAK